MSHECRGAGEQWWRSGENTRLPPVWLGFDSRTRHHMWVEFVVVSYPLLQEVFLRVLQFSSFLKSRNFQIPIRSGECPQLVLSAKCSDS